MGPRAVPGFREFHQGNGHVQKNKADLGAFGGSGLYHKKNSCTFQKIKDMVTTRCRRVHLGVYKAKPG